jgi:hypothetical protein
MRSRSKNETGKPASYTRIKHPLPTHLPLRKSPTTNHNHNNNNTTE